MDSYGENDKIPLKLAEISIQKFNQTIPQYLGLLKNHKCNIEKAASLADWDRIKREQINATRVIKQMKYLILEIDKVRARIREDDLDRFDDGCEGAKKQAVAGMGEYMDLQQKIFSRSQSSYSLEDDLRQQNQQNDIQDNQYGGQLRQIPQITSAYDGQAEELRQRAECLREMENLQREVEEIQDLFQAVHKMTHGQAEMVNAVEENVEVTQVHVEEGEAMLRKALKYKKAIYPMCGALLGTCIGGPIGLIAGLKAGGLAALGGGFIGFAGGNYIKAEDGTALDSVDAGDQGIEVQANGEALIEPEPSLAICERKQ
ncbi:syntaxin-17 [Uranotaenia lowii]|uniref:syntaxin-17 n=1 Tax=Uranotaenia lowii TaxID=190385 RepID=UPI002479523C|nr:syntaxin-17 [Uranotaenia lowii]